jgi:hypothetical protein
MRLPDISPQPAAALSYSPDRDYIYTKRFILFKHTTLRRFNTVIFCAKQLIAQLDGIIVYNL